MCVHIHTLTHTHPTSGIKHFIQVIKPGLKYLLFHLLGYDLGQVTSLLVLSSTRWKVRYSDLPHRVV